MHKVSYRVSLSNSSSQFGIAKSYDNVVAVMDGTMTEASFDINTVMATQVSELSIHSTRMLPRSTVVTSNTAGLDATNVYDEDGTPIFYKIRRIVRSFLSVSISGEEILTYDKNFIYTNTKAGNVKYSIDGEADIIDVLSERIDVFIHQSELHLTEVMNIDGRTYSHKSGDGDTVVSVFRKKSVSVRVKEGDLLKLEPSEKGLLEVQPFITSRSDDSRGTTYEYRYLDSAVSVSSVVDEQCLEVGGVLHLRKHNVINGSVSVRIVNKNGSLVEMFDAVRIPEEMVANASGRILVSGLTDLDSAKDKIYLVSYEFMSRPSRSIYIDYQPVRGDIRAVEAYILPTKVMTKESVATVAPSIAYRLIGTSNDIATESKRLDQARSRNIDPVVPGEGSYISDFITYMDTKNYNNGYMSGPYSGTNSADGFLEAAFLNQDTSELGSEIEGGLIRCYEFGIIPKDMTSVVLVNRNIATPASDVQYISEREVVPGTVLYSHLPGFGVDIVHSVSADIVKTASLFGINGTIERQTDSETNISFDISDITHGISINATTMEADSFQYVLSELLNPYAFAKSNAMLIGSKSYMLNIEDFSLVSLSAEGVELAVSASMTVDEELNTISATVLNQGVYSVGLKYLDVSPATYIII